MLSAVLMWSGNSIELAWTPLSPPNVQESGITGICQTRVAAKH